MTKVMAIASATYRELLRTRLLYGVRLVATFLVIIASIFGSVTIGDQLLVIKDFGLFSASLSSVALATIAGAALLQKELARRTVFSLLAKPVQRWEFLLGKYCGMCLAQAVLLGASLLLLQVFLLCFGAPLEASFLLAFVFMLLEALVLNAAALFFSSIVVTPLLSGLFTLAVFMAGRSVDYLLYFVEQGTVSGILASICRGAYAVLPQLGKLHINNEIVFGASTIGLERLCWSSVYALSYSGILVILAVIAFGRREFN